MWHRDHSNISGVSKRGFSLRRYSSVGTLSWGDGCWLAVGVAAGGGAGFTGGANAGGRATGGFTLKKNM